MGPLAQFLHQRYLCLRRRKASVTKEWATADPAVAIPRNGTTLQTLFAGYPGRSRACTREQIQFPSGHVDHTSYCCDRKDCICGFYLGNSRFPFAFRTSPEFHLVAKGTFGVRLTGTTKPDRFDLNALSHTLGNRWICFQFRTFQCEVKFVESPGSRAFSVVRPLV